MQELSRTSVRDLVQKNILKRIVDALLANKSFDNCNNIDDIINVCKACEIEKLLGIKACERKKLLGIKNH